MSNKKKGNLVDPFFVKVIKNYKSTNENELSLKINHVLVVVGDQQDHWYGYFDPNTPNFFPKDCVVRLNQESYIQNQEEEEAEVEIEVEKEEIRKRSKLNSLNESQLKHYLSSNHKITSKKTQKKKEKSVNNKRKKYPQQLNKMGNNKVTTKKQNQKQIFKNKLFNSLIKTEPIISQPILKKNPKNIQNNEIKKNKNLEKVNKIENTFERKKDTNNNESPKHTNKNNHFIHTKNNFDNNNKKKINKNKKDNFNNNINNNLKNPNINIINNINKNNTNNKNNFNKIIIPKKTNKSKHKNKNNNTNPIFYKNIETIIQKKFIYQLKDYEPQLITVQEDKSNMTERILKRNQKHPKKKHNQDHKKTLFVNYSILVNGECVTKHRFKHFIFLRKILFKTFFSIPIPPIPW
ncbi:sorting nexin [Anaeramoeba flamelloides]|uniref:Sorting nexin n=1 Tax=Anaeramoeba flamelloides TaxID=1746091 RepID=A0ABQ8YVG4_9EUKA|nr:sorting nexin [Anaeramoeba flamelloides]